MRSYDKIESILDGQAFSGNVTVPTEAFGVAWNGSNQVPTKNAVYDRDQDMHPGPGSISATPYSMTAADCHRNTPVWVTTGSITAINLVGDPTDGGLGCTVCFMLRSAFMIRIDPGGTDVIETAAYNLENGTALALVGGDRLELAGVVGNAVCLSGFDANTWVTLPGTLGVVTDGN